MTDKGFNPLRRLGRTNLEVNAFSMGGAGIGIDSVTDGEAVEAVRLALDAGIQYIDTSPLYGESERRVGMALEQIDRSAYVLSTKTGTHPERRGDYTREGTLWSVENSLRLLKTDYIDLLLVHDPTSDADMDVILGPDGAIDALEQLKARGVIGWIGLGQRNHAWHRRAIESGRVDVILTYNDYHPIRTTALSGGLLELAQKADVGVINGSPLAHGLLFGGDPFAINEKLGMRQTEEDVRRAKRLYDWCRAENVSMLAFVLQFCLRQDLIGCTLTGARNASELAENIAALRASVPEAAFARDWTTAVPAE